MRKVALSLLVFAAGWVHAQTAIKQVHWYSLEEAERLNKTAPKKILIDVYTDWCGWCKKMDQTTFSHPVIAELLSKYFYTVKFNAETTDTIQFNGAKYINLIRGQRSTHPLALSLLNWRPSYPSIVYFTERLEYLGVIPGYKTPEQMEAILNYIALEKYRNISLEEFQKTFKGTINTAPAAQ
ncbi:MAG: thioredoxin family protein [Bacteroidales bacterium]